MQSSRLPESTLPRVIGEGILIAVSNNAEGCTMFADGVFAH
jgi:hypothetical protein